MMESFCAANAERSNACIRRREPQRTELRNDKDESRFRKSRTLSNDSKRANDRSGKEDSTCVKPTKDMEDSLRKNDLTGKQNPNCVTASAEKAEPKELQPQTKRSDSIR